MCLLTNYNFIKVGSWEKDEGLKSGVRFCLKKMEEVRTIYSFVVKKNVMYIGICQDHKTTLKKRMSSYQWMSGSGQNKRVVSEIRNILENKGKVEIWAFKIEEQESVKFEDLEIDIVAGLEKSLITEFNPEWNISR